MPSLTSIPPLHLPWLLTNASLLPSFLFLLNFPFSPAVSQLEKHTLRALTGAEFFPVPHFPSRLHQSVFIPFLMFPAISQVSREKK